MKEKDRIYFGIMMSAGFLTCLFLFGKILTAFLACMLYLMVYDELQVSFLKRERFSSLYFKERYALYIFFFSFFFLVLFPVMKNFFFILSFLLTFILLIQFFRKETLKIEIIFLSTALNMSLFSLFLQQERWIQDLLGLVILTALTDTGGFLFGKFFGEYLLAPQISPKKTWEGFVGGIFLGTIGAVLVTGKFRLFFLFIILTILAQLGDLLESYLKRQYEIKDSANLIPGHGGIYDRLDSIIFVLPFYLAIITGNL